MNDLFLSLVVFITAFVACLFLIPVVIETAQSKSLFDVPNGRKQHKQPIPPLGGIAIFISMVVSFFLWSDLQGMAEAKFAFLGMLVLFFMGLKDDLVEIEARKKFIIQISLASLIAFGGIRITHLHGIFGLDEIPVVFQYALTVLFIVGLTNAYNLIDGIDGLAGGIALIASFGFGILFFALDIKSYSLASFALAGSLLGFLRFNFSPAKIFMGDTGSLSVGILLAILSIQLLETTSALSGFVHVNSFFPVLVFALIIVPILDVSQVMLVRIMSGRSPFSPDRGHIHHMLLRRGMSHRQAALALYGGTLAFIGVFSLGFWIGLSHFQTLCIALGFAALSIYYLHMEDRSYS